MVNIVFLNLLAVTDGGQVTRSEAFINRFRKYDESSKLIIFRRKNSLKFCEKVTNSIIVDVFLTETIFRPWIRLIWENTALKFFSLKYKPDVYLTFSHYLPFIISSEIFSIVGVTNLAPFSKRAMKNEPVSMKVKMRLLKVAIIASSKRANKVIALSEYCKQLLIENKVDGEKIEVISNGVSVTNTEKSFNLDVLNEFNIKKDFILYVSSFFPYKNFDIVIDAYSKLPIEVQNKYKLLLIGKIQDREYFDYLVSKSQMMNIEDKVIFIDHIGKEKLLSFYKFCEIFIFASLIENCPNILLESMACAAPVLCSNKKPMPEFLGDAGIYFDPLDKKSLSKSILTLLKDEELKKRLKNKSLERSKSYSWNTFTKKTIDLYL